MADKPFRVLMDLTDLYLEKYKYVWINVSPREIKTISDFKIALLNKINFEREDIKLFVRDGLLLERETINVLREDDTVRVQYEGHSESNSAENSGKESRKSSRKRNRSQCNVGDVPSEKKRFKIDSGISSQLSESNFFQSNNETKKRKEKPPNLVSLEVNTAVDCFETSQSNHNKLKHQKKKDKKKSALIENSSIKECGLSQQNDSLFSFPITDVTNKQNENNTSLDAANINQGSFIFDSTKDASKTNDDTHERRIANDTSEPFKADVKKTEEVFNCPKKKRKRHRKRKNTESIQNDTLNKSDTKFFTPNTKFASISENINAEAKHVVFSPVSYEKKFAAICDMESNVVPNSSRATFAVTKSTSNVNHHSFKVDYPKISTPTQSDGCCTPSWHVSMMQSRSSSFRKEHTTCKEEEPLKESTVVKSFVKTIQDSEENKFPPEIDYEDLPVLNSIPKIGTHFVYKTLELDDTYSPTISKYRQGIVKGINPDTEEIEIELSKHMIKPGRTGKFENLKDDEIPTPEVKRFDNLRWSAIFSPKQLS